MLYLKEFENHSTYTVQQESLITPNVSYCKDVNDVHYKQKIPDNSVLFICKNIQPNITGTVDIYYDNSTHPYDLGFSVDKNNKLYKYICTQGFNRIRSTNNIISTVTLNKIDKINSTGYYWFPTNVESVSIKDCVILDGCQLNSMCSGCTNLVKFEATNFDTSKVTNMDNAFTNCSNLVSLDLSGFKGTSRITNMQNLFSGCQNLKEINMSGWNLAPSVQTNSNGMFGNVNEVNSLVGTNGIKFIMKNVGPYTRSTIEDIISNFNRDLSTAGRPNITYSIEE